MILSVFHSHKIVGNTFSAICIKRLCAKHLLSDVAFGLHRNMQLDALVGFCREQVHIHIHQGTFLIYLIADACSGQSAGKECLCRKVDRPVFCDLQGMKPLKYTVAVGEHRKRYGVFADTVPQLLLGHCPGICRIIVGEQLEQPSPGVLPALYHVAFYKPGFFGNAQLFNSVFKSDIRTVGVCRLRLYHSSGSEAGNIQRLQLCLENYLLTPVNADIAGFFDGLAWYKLTVFIKNLQIGVLTVKIIRRNNGQLTFHKLLIIIGLGIKDENGIGVFFCYRLTLHHTEKRLQLQLFQRFESVINVAQGIVLPCLDDCTGQHIVKHHREHILRNLPHRICGIRTNAPQCRGRTHFFRQELLSFQFPINLLERRHRGIAAGHTGDQGTVPNRTRLILRKEAVGR